MQILLNQNDMQAAAIAHVQDLFALSDDQSLMVDLIDDGTAVVTVLSPGEEPEPVSTAPEGGKPTRKPRRTKAQIAEDERLAAEQAEAAKQVDATQTSSAESAQASGGASPEAAKDPSPEADKPVEETGAATPEPAVVVEEPQAEPEPEVKDPEPETPADPEPEVQVEQEDVKAATEQPATKPAEQSLFANLRKPQNS